MLEVLTRAPSTKLTTQAAVTARLENPAGDNPLIDDTLIPVASRLVSNALGREPELQQYRQTAVGQGRYGTPLLRLARFPIDPDRVTVKLRGEPITDWVVADPREGLLFRSAAWPRGQEWDAAGVALIEITYWGGWILPGEIADWSNAAPKTLGVWVRPTKPQHTPLLFECTTAGTTASAEPTWPTPAGDTVADNDIVWTGRRLEELPDPLQDYTYLTVVKLYEDPPDGLIAEGTVGIGNQQYSVDSVADRLPLAARHGIAAYRRAA